MLLGPLALLDTLDVPISIEFDFCSNDGIKGIIGVPFGTLLEILIGIDTGPFAEVVSLIPPNGLLFAFPIADELRGNNDGIPIDEKGLLLFIWVFSPPSVM